ncbi:metal-dependent hydrolase [Anaerobacillus sp. MEB173]|uniref:metal-dependent hydrolase n=1 Tax=Anaerobacillus sp. MEB173 TaxID=3383345 RepID=UPI003F8D91E1
MDTGTHVVMGIGLGGLATLDPVVGNDPALAQAVMIGTIIGSQAPDFDTILKLKNNATYIRNHRGMTHSIPAVIIWPLLITAGIFFFVPEANLLHLWLWTFLAVFLHVFVDLFNAYGTQGLAPFSKRWIAFGIINIFDPFIFFSHIIAIILWRYGFDPGYTFLTLYIVLIFYYIWRTNARHSVIKHAKRIIPDATHVFISPSFKWNQWHLVIRTRQYLYVAESRNHQINFFEKYEFIPIPDTPLINAARKDDNLHAFLSFSPTYRWEVEEKKDYNEVRFIDLRYRSKGHYPFVAIVKLDHDYNILSSYTGWVYSEETLKKKLEFATD